MTTPIDLSQLPTPRVVERLDYEEILAALKDELLAEDASLAEVLELESEPLTKLLQVVAYRETVLRARVNDAARSVMLAYAQDEDLDHLGALFGVERLETDPGDPDAIPPEPAEYESDSEMRRRIQLSLYGLSVAGPEGAYVYHALSADGDVLDASAHSPEPGEVVVSVLAREGDGSAGSELLASVEAAVSAEDVRPLTDHVTVQSAEILDYTIEATLFTDPGPDPQVVIDAAREAVEAYAEAQHRLGRNVTRSGLYAALHRPGVTRVTLEAPTETLEVSRQQAAWCTDISLTDGGVDD